MMTTLDQLESAPKGNMVSNKHCYPQDKYEILCHTLYTQDTQDTLEGKCRIGERNRILLVAT